ncbi:MAG: AAA family ATPase, partial [Ignavibacteria bacterium]|nr:AAA family ATPase [Ignavibacteria bacterium]
MLLSGPIVNRIIEQNSKLDESGSILSNSQLEKYYQLFRLKFGPEVLASLDGETLLNTMHDSSNHDSLVYWLEFKNDEELPNRFGGIGGGSALKFGVYRRGETKNWVTGSPQKQEQISVEQAITIARKHREQLLAGVKLLENLPLNASNDDYAKLQKQMDEIAPDVSNTAWGHKYFSMLFPEKLEDYHNANFQRFHLIKLLQMPVSMEGRYSVTGQYMAISRELGMHINNLTRILNVYDGTPYRYWAIKANLSGNASANWKHWEEMKDGGFIGIGWKSLGDLSGITYDRESRAKIKTLMLEKYNEKGGFAQEIFNFVTVIKKGDLVIATEKQGHNLGIGRVTSGYYYEGQSDVSNRLKVEWLSTDPWETP